MALYTDANIACKNCGQYPGNHKWTEEKGEYFRLGNHDGTCKEYIENEADAKAAADAKKAEADAKAAPAAGA